MMQIQKLGADIAAAVDYQESLRLAPDQPDADEMNHFIDETTRKFVAESQPTR